MTIERPRLQLKFWGVRGSTPTPIAENLGYGGNTSCMEILGASGERIIIDAGSGIRSLGLKLAAEDLAQDLHLFFTHFHWDHIQGIPFFPPLFAARNTVTFHSFPDEDEIRKRLERQMSAPYFTLDFNDARADRRYSTVNRGNRCGGLSITPFPLHHPQGACGYRVESQGASAVIATDVEHGDSRLDAILRENAEGADLLVYDAQYTPAEYSARKGWGHSTFAAAAAVAKDAKVKQLVLFHHDPTHSDSVVSEMVEQSRALFENTIAACESHSISF